MTQAELMGHAIRGLHLSYDDRVARLAGMKNRELAAQLDSLMNQLMLMRAVALMAKEQGYLDAMIEYLREGTADEQAAA